MNQNSKVDDGAARKNNPPTKEYEEAWERMFGKGRQQQQQEDAKK